MIAISLFLLGSQPGQGGLQLRDISYYLQQATNAFKITPTELHAQYLAVILQPLLLNCREIASRSSLCTPDDQITLLLQHTAHGDVTAALLTTWAGLLQVLQHKRSGLFTLVLAAILWKRQEFPRWALWCDLQGVRGQNLKRWGHIHSFIQAEVQTLLLYICSEYQQSDYEEENVQRVDQLATLLATVQQSLFIESGRDRVFTADACWKDFFAVVSQISMVLPHYSYENLTIPYLRPSSIHVRYQENRGELDPAQWPFLSTNTLEDDRFGVLLTSIGYQHHSVAPQIPQWHEPGLPGGGTPRVHCRVEIGQPVCVECVIQNPLNEPVICSNVHLVSVAVGNGNGNGNSSSGIDHCGENYNGSVNSDGQMGMVTLRDDQQKEVNACMKMSEIEFLLNPLESRTLQLMAVPTHAGTVRLAAVQFSIQPTPSSSTTTTSTSPSTTKASPIVFTQPLTLRGKRLQRTLEQRKQITYSEDNALTLHLIESAVAVAVKLEGVKRRHFFSELVPVDILVKNCGNRPLTRVVMMTDNFHWFVNTANMERPLTQSPTGMPATSDSVITFELLSENDQPLLPGATLTVSSFIHLPESEGSAFLLSSSQYEAISKGKQGNRENGHEWIEKGMGMGLSKSGYDCENNDDNNDDNLELEEDPSEDSQDQPVAYYDLHYILLASDGEQTRMVRDGMFIPLSPLLKCSTMVMESEEKMLVRCVAENLAGNTMVDEVQVGEE